MTSRAIFNIVMFAMAPDGSWRVFVLFAFVASSLNKTTLFVINLLRVRIKSSKFIILSLKYLANFNF